MGCEMGRSGDPMGVISYEGKAAGLEGPCEVIILVPPIWVQWRNFPTLLEIRVD